MDSEGTTFVILMSHANAPIRKEGLSLTTKARTEASPNKFVEKGGVPDRGESFGEVDSSKNRPRARSEFVDHQALNFGQKEWNIWLHSALEKYRDQQKGKERKTSFLLQKDSESRSKRQSYPNELSEN